MDTELFELCKEVDRRTNFSIGLGMFHFDKDGNVRMRSYRDGVSYSPERGDTPLYTSDYLLEKLPTKITHKGTDYFYYLEMFEDGTFGAGYGFTDEGGHVDHPKIGVLTARKAQLVNLKLVIALDDAGVKL
jgi:hypothetical protein